MDEEGVRALIRQRFPGHGGQRDLAIKAGVSTAYVSLFLNGKRSVGKKIAKALGLIEKKTVTRIYTCANVPGQV